MLAIIDGDILVYHACRTRNVKDSEGRTITPVFTQEQDDKYVEECWNRMISQLEAHKDAVYATSCKIAVKGDSNFRDQVFAKYKAHRAESPIAFAVKALRKRLVEEGIAIKAEGMEADDQIRIWRQEAKASNTPCIICSVDKDLKMIPGKHYNLKSREISDISEEMAERVFYEQILKGDSTDNIGGLPGIGDIKARRMLESSVTSKEMQQTVVDAYYLQFGHTWEEELLITGSLIYLLKSKDDKFSIDKWDIERPQICNEFDDEALVSDDSEEEQAVAPTSRPPPLVPQGTLKA